MHLLIEYLSPLLAKAAALFLEAAAISSMASTMASPQALRLLLRVGPEAAEEGVVVAAAGIVRLLCPSMRWFTSSPEP